MTSIICNLERIYNHLEAGPVDLPMGDYYLDCAELGQPTHYGWCHSVPRILDCIDRDRALEQRCPAMVSSAPCCAYDDVSHHDGLHLNCEQNKSFHLKLSCCSIL